MHISDLFNWDGTRTKVHTFYATEILYLCGIQVRRSLAKLELYRRFTNALAISVLLSVAWIGYEVFFPPFSPVSLLRLMKILQM